MSLIDIFNKNKDTKIQSCLCGIDCGFGYYKISSGDTNLKFISIVGEPVSDFARTAAVSSMNELLNALAITYNGKKYYVGRNAIVNTRNGRISLRQSNNDDIQTKIKIMTALGLLTNEDQTDAEFDIVVGLPVLEYKNSHEKLYNLLVNGNHPFEFIMHYGNNEVLKKIKLNNIKVISQGEAAFYSYIIDLDGEIIKSRAENVAGVVMIVDIGYKTTDIVTMENGRYIEPLSDQLNKGVSQIHQEVLRLTMEQHNVKKELKDMDDIVRTGKLFHNRNEYDMSNIIREAAKPFAEDIVENLYTINNGDLGSLQTILLTGGGAEIVFPYIKDILKQIVNVEKLYNAEFSNSQGYYRYGKLLKNKGMFGANA